MSHKSAYRGTLIMPGGSELAYGDDVKITKELAENEGIKQWVTDGFIVEAGEWSAPPVPADVVALTAERDGLTAERDDLANQLADLQAQLDAAKAPKK